MKQIKNILWDFDGVILDSMPIRDYGFRKIFENFDDSLVDRLIEYHNQNGGLSRFHKIKYFYNELLKQDITEEQINQYAERFSEVMRNELINPKYLIPDSIEFIHKNYQKFNFHIVSGSEHQELNYLCERLEVCPYFISINGSPTQKIDLIKVVMDKYSYRQDETILIGDSINDFEAAEKNGVLFYGYNNFKLHEAGFNYIDVFKTFILKYNILSVSI